MITAENIGTLKRKLDYHYARYDKSKISPDPLEIPHLYSERNNIELVAFLASVFAYGGVKQILKTLYSLSNLLGENPVASLSDIETTVRRVISSQIKYRFYSNADVANLLRLLAHFREKYGSLENLFMKGYNENDRNVRNAAENFSLAFLQACKEKGCLTRGIKFMFPRPSKGSAAKRMNLFLRWMVRDDELDFGLWRGVRKNALVIPLDVHVARIARKLGLTARKSNDWKTAEEITETLKLFDKNDPVKYDFALCHIGMRKEEF